MTRVGLLKVNEACLSGAAPVDTMMEPECACAKHLCSITDLMYNQPTALIQTFYHDIYVSFYATMIASNCLKCGLSPLFMHVCESFLYKHLYLCNQRFCTYFLSVYLHSNHLIFCLHPLIRNPLVSFCLAATWPFSL